MTEHITERQIGDYFKNLLTSEALLDFDDHLAECQVCRKLVKTRAGIDRIFAAVYSELQKSNGSDHVSYQQLADYIDSRLNDIDRENVESHLQVCSNCASEEKDLSSFRVTLETEELVPAKAVSFWRTPLSLTPIRLMGLAAALVAISLFTIFRYQNEVKELKRKLNHTQSEMTQLQEQKNLLQRDLDSFKQYQIPTVLNDGAVQWKYAQGKLTGIIDLPETYQKMIQEAFIIRKMKKPELSAELAGTSGILLSTQQPGVPFSLAAPLGTIERTDRPTFMWSPLKGAAEYRVAIYDSEFNEVAISPALKKTEWTMSDSIPRGQIYTWQVTAIKDNQEILSPTPPAPEARFKILEDAKVKELEMIEKKYPSLHVLRGLIYAREGLLNAAKREVEILQNENPDSQIAQDFLQSLQK